MISSPNRDFTDEGALKTNALFWAEAITQAVNLREIKTGTGSPEGNINGSKTQIYMDETGASGAVLYIKQVDDIAGDRSLGWILV